MQLTSVPCSYGMVNRFRCWRRFSATSILNRNDVVRAIVVICVTTGCVHTQAKRPSLGDVLRLETSIPATDLQSANKVRGRFSLRNIASAAIELCEVDTGVTVVAITDRGAFPLVGHGVTSDAQPMCYELRPSEAKEFSEEFTWSPTMAFEQLKGSIRVSARRGGDTVLITSNPVLVGRR